MLKHNFFRILGCLSLFFIEISRIKSVSYFEFVTLHKYS